MVPIQISKVPQGGLDLDELISGGSLGLESKDPAPEDVRLPEGVSLKAHVERGEGASVHVRGHLKAKVLQLCARCLGEAPSVVDQELDLFFLPESELRSDLDDEEGVELQDRDLVVSYYANDFLDLSAIVREQILLAQPMKRLCREDCRGVCPQCGADRNETSCACSASEGPKDSPFRALAGLKALS